MTLRGWDRGTCPSCGRVWRRERPADPVVCDCFEYCGICGEKLEPYSADSDPRTYRNEDIDDPTGSTPRDEATLRTRLRCPRCGVISDGVPSEVEVR